MKLMFILIYFLSLFDDLLKVSFCGKWNYFATKEKNFWGLLSHTLKHFTIVRAQKKKSSINLSKSIFPHFPLLRALLTDKNKKFSISQFLLYFCYGFFLLLFEKVYVVWVLIKVQHRNSKIFIFQLIPMF